MSDDDTQVDAAQVDAYLDAMEKLIEEHGWAVQGVSGSGPDDYCYTVGLSSRDLPELIICGLPFQTAATILNDTATLMVAGQPLAHGDHAPLGGGYEMTAVDVDEVYLTMLTMAKAFSDKPIRALQLVWPSAEHLYPWDAGYDDASVGSVALLSSKIPPAKD